MQTPPTLTEAPSKRLSKDQRRCQLLDVARSILEEDGASAMTLAVLAERAGVSKPIAYDHFGTRSGLLIALLNDTNRFYEANAEAQLLSAPETLPEIAKIVAKAYVACSIDAGPAMTMLSAAAEADAEARSTGRLFRSQHAKQFQRAFKPVLSGNSKRLPVLFRSLVAAANSICDERLTGHLTTKAAVEMLTHLFITSLQPFERKAPKERN